MGIAVRRRYSRIPYWNLQNIIHRLISENKNIGYRQVTVRLRLMGHQVRRANVIQTIAEIFGPRNQRRRVARRVYRVRAQLSIVHIDGNHKISRK
jgi:hypothetical protein